MAPVDRGEDARQDICLALEEMGFEIEASDYDERGRAGTRSISVMTRR